MQLQAGTLESPREKGRLPGIGGKWRHRRFRRCIETSYLTES
jgi:hypothetical protein